jgi:hypothetical protein
MHSLEKFFNLPSAKLLPGSWAAVEDDVLWHRWCGVQYYIETVFTSAQRSKSIDEPGKDLHIMRHPLGPEDGDDFPMPELWESHHRKMHEL